MEWESPGDAGKKPKIRRVELLTGAGAEDDGKLFVSPDRRSSFERSYRNRSVYSGKRVDLSDFGEPRVTAMVEALGWTPIICMDHPVFPRLVRLFYCNMEFDLDRPSITSLVNGTPIHLTCDSLSPMLGIPNDGVRYYKTGNSSRDDPHILEGVRLVCGNDKISTCLRPQCRSLPAENRLLHDMVMSMFLPRGCSRDRVSRMDLFILTKILRGERANLPFIIIRHMIDSMHNKYLPYGMLLSKIFVACKVGIAEDEFREKLKMEEVYNSNTIHKIVSTKGGKSKEAQQYSDQEAMEDEDEEEEEKQLAAEMDGMHGDLSSDGPKSCSSSEAGHMYESLNKLSARVDTLATSVETLRCQQEQGLTKLTAQLDVMMDFLNRHFWPYPPPPSPFAG